MTTEALSVVIPGLRLVSEMNARDHWRARMNRKRKQKEAVALMLQSKRSKPIPVPCVVTITRIGLRTLDGDNLQSSAKAARDQIAEWLGVDDGEDCVTWQYAQQSCKGLEYRYGVRIDIAPRPA